MITLLAIVGFALFTAFIIGYCLGNMRRLTRLGFNQENLGEMSVRVALIEVFNTKNYHLMNNLTLPCDDGTTQIDHILVSTKGIFVIESKHYTGWIFANASTPVWTQVIFKQKHKFQNPIHQNYKHVKVIEHLLDFIPNERIHSMVVFTGDAEFKTGRPNGVFDIDELKEQISRFTEDVISPNKLHIAVGRLECTRRLISGKTDVEHQFYLRRKFGDA